MSDHVWKIGDWAELYDTRCLVFYVTEDCCWVVKKVPRWGDDQREDTRMPLKNNPELKHLPDCIGWDWQPTPTPAPKYRPFANAAEFALNKGRWVYFCDNTNDQLLIYSFNNRGIFHAGKCTSWEAMFSQCKFDNGEPFGVEVTE